MSSFDHFRCPHAGCMVHITEDCHPHTEFIGDMSERQGLHCWNFHQCVMPHYDAWVHVEAVTA